MLKQAVRRAAFFKANALALRLNEYFEYASAPALVAPYALSPAQLQELTDYGLRYHLQVVPYLDAPAHANFLLNHDEYKHLRAFPDVAFEMCVTNPETYKLLEGMFQDLIDATRGVKYFHFSTDEAWFVGKADNEQCREVQRAKELGSPSKLLAEFIQKTSGYLQSHGRKVIFWGEHPLKVEDIAMLPEGLINGEVYGPAYNEAFRKRGIRQMIYTNSQPDDPLFPAYSVLSPKDQVHPRVAEERATRAFEEISFTSARKEAEIVGVDVYAWGDLGPHPETFWLGYALGASAAWHPGSPEPQGADPQFLPPVLRPRVQRHGPALPTDEHAGAVLRRQLGQHTFGIPPAGLRVFVRHRPVHSAHLDPAAAARAHGRLSAAQRQLEPGERAARGSCLEVPGRER